MNNEINKRIVKYRNLAGLTQTKTAEKLDMKCSTYSQMERKGNIKAEIIEKLAEIFNIDPCVLIFGEEFDKKDDRPVAPIQNNSKLTDKLTLKEPTFSSPIPMPPKTNMEELSPKEQNIIKILRNLSKEDRDDIYKFIQDKLK